MHSKRIRLIFLLPRCYKPHKPNFATKYELLSDRCTGHIVTISGQKVRNLPVASFLFHSEPDSRSFPKRNFRRFWIQALYPLYRLYKKENIDAVIAYDPYSSAFSAIILKCALRTKMILEVNGDYHKRDESISLVKRLIMKMMFEVAVRFADAVKVLNCEQEIYLRRLFPRKQIYRFPNFVATEYFGSLNAFKGDYLLSVGHPFHLKGMDILIRAFKRLCNRFPKARLKIMGYCPNPELQWYKELAGNDPRIEFVPPGWIEEVGEQVRGCLALVNAARSEAMGRIHVEAMACKKPIVASRTSGALECVEDGRTGLLCEVGDDVDLAEKLEQFLSDADLATRMGRAGLERMRKIFSQEKYVSSFMAMVEEVVATQGARLAGHNDGSRQDCSVGKESIATSKTV